MSEEQQVIRYETDHIDYKGIEAIVDQAEIEHADIETLIRCGSAVKSLGDWRAYLVLYPRSHRNPRQG